MRTQRWMKWIDDQDVPSRRGLRFVHAVPFRHLAAFAPPARSRQHRTYAVDAGGRISKVALDKVAGKELSADVRSTDYAAAVEAWMTVIETEAFELLDTLRPRRRTSHRHLWPLWMYLALIAARDPRDGIDLHSPAAPADLERLRELAIGADAADEQKIARVARRLIDLDPQDGFALALRNLLAALTPAVLAFSRMHLILRTSEHELICSDRPLIWGGEPLRSDMRLALSPTLMLVATQKQIAPLGSLSEQEAGWHNREAASGASRHFFALSADAALRGRDSRAA